MNQALGVSLLVGVVLALLTLPLSGPARSGRAVLALVGALVGGMLGWTLLSRSPATGWWHPGTVVGAVVGAVVPVLIGLRWAVALTRTPAPAAAARAVAPAGPAPGPSGRSALAVAVLVALRSRGRR